ncbi:MAG: OmpH family outer membrane protein [Nitrospirota bacterium]
MKKILFLMIVLLFAFNAHSAELKIAYIDLNKAVSDSSEGMAAVKELEKAGKLIEASIEEKRLEITNLEQEIIKQASVLNPDAIKDKQDKLKKLQRTFQRAVKDSQEEFDRKRAGFMRRIVSEIGEVVAEIGKKEGYTLILEKMQSGVMYIPDELNITQKVLESYNASKEAKKK